MNVFCCLWNFICKWLEGDEGLLAMLKDKEPGGVDHSQGNTGHLQGQWLQGLQNSLLSQNSGGSTFSPPLLITPTVNTMM